MNKILPFILFLLLGYQSASSFGSNHFDNNLNIRKAHQFLLALRPISANKILDLESAANPANGYVSYYRLYSEVIILMITNSSDSFKRMEPTLDRYIDNLKDLPDNTPDYRLLLGESKVYMGLLHLKYGSKLSGLLQCLKGYNLLEENQRRYPLFEPTAKISGMIQLSVAFMPKILQWGIKILGIKGDPERGLKKLSDFSTYAAGKPGYEEEGFIFTMAAYKLMNQENELTKLIHERSEHFANSALTNYIAATVCAEANDAETALKLLKAIVPTNLEIPFPPKDYLIGKVKMMRLDADANVSLQTYLKESAGSDYIKATLYELACYYLTIENRSEYLSYIDQIKIKGRAMHNRDIEAEYEATTGEVPNIILMRSDFLTRGGYIQRAEDELKTIKEPLLLPVINLVQYYYLKGECLRQKNLISEAESAYLKTVELGSASGNHLVQKALVQAALMYEKGGNKPFAAKYYQLALNFNAKSNPYSDLYSNKAKSGLIRLSFPDQ